MKPKMVIVLIGILLIIGIIGIVAIVSLPRWNSHSYQENWGAVTGIFVEFKHNATYVAASQEFQSLGLQLPQNLERADGTLLSFVVDVPNRQNGSVVESYLARIRGLPSVQSASPAAIQ